MGATMGVGGILILVKWKVGVMMMMTMGPVVRLTLCMVDGCNKCNDL